jgi:cell cycle checkpoint protein
LVLTGPSGCAKTATINAVASEMGFEINEFECGVNTNAFGPKYKEHGVYQYKTSGQSFRDFVLSCILNSTLQFAIGDRIVPKKRHIALIDDFPPLTDGMKSMVHDCFRHYLAASQVTSPIVIVISNIQSCDESFSGDRALTIREVLPIGVRNHFRVEQIQFNPIAKTIMTKALNRICEIEFRNRPRSKPSKQTIEDISLNSEGDIRSAISSLQLCLLGKGAFGDAKRDHQVSLFSGLGKILYNKRIFYLQGNDSVAACENNLCSELVHLQRKEMGFLPEVILHL